MSIDIDNNITKVINSTTTALEVSSSIPVEAIPANTGVLARKKQYSIVGDAVYVSMSEDVPEWMQNILDTLVDNKLSDVSSLAAAMQASFISAAQQIELAKNAYTNSVALVETLEGVMINHVEGINASVGDLISATVLRMETAIATERAAVAGALSLVQAEVHNATAGILAQETAVAMMRDDLDAYNDAMLSGFGVFGEAAATRYDSLSATVQGLVNDGTATDQAIKDLEDLAEELGIALDGEGGIKEWVEQIREAVGENDTLNDILERLKKELEDQKKDFSALISKLETSLADANGLIAGAIETYRTEVDGTVYSVIQDFNVSMSHVLGPGKAATSTGITAVTTGDSSVVADLTSIVAEGVSRDIDGNIVNTFSTSTNNFDIAYVGSLPELTDVMLTRKNKYLAEAGTTQAEINKLPELVDPDDTESREYKIKKSLEDLKATQEAQARVLQERIDFLENHEDTLGTFAGFSGIENISTVDGISSKFSGITFLNTDAVSVAALYADTVRLGRKDGNGNYPLSIIGNEVVFDDSKYRKTEIVQCNDTDDAISAVTGVSYLYNNTSSSSQLSISFSMSTPPNGARIDIINARKGDIKITNPPISGFDIIPFNGAATFTYYNGVWYAIGTIEE
jgi:hypothetical protein